MRVGKKFGDKIAIPAGKEKIRMDSQNFNTDLLDGQKFNTIF